MEELRPGLWTWTAPHPEWTPEQGGPDGWERDVRSYAYDAGAELVVFDPMSPPSGVDQLAAGKELALLLTCHWHQRSAVELAGRLGVTIHAPEGDLERIEAPVTAYRAGDVLPGGVEASAGLYPDEATLWLPAHRALLTGDVILGTGSGVRAAPDSWLPEGVTPEDLRDRLRELLELPLELILPTHGAPVVADARQALARTLAA